MQCSCIWKKEKRKTVENLMQIVTMTGIFHEIRVYLVCAKHICWTMNVWNTYENEEPIKGLFGCANILSSIKLSLTLVIISKRWRKEQMASWGSLLIAHGCWFFEIRGFFGNVVLFSQIYRDLGAVRFPYLGIPIANYKRIICDHPLWISKQALSAHLTIGQTWHL